VATGTLQYVEHEQDAFILSAHRSSGGNEQQFAMEWETLMQKSSLAPVVNSKGTFSSKALLPPYLERSSTSKWGAMSTDG